VYHTCFATKQAAWCRCVSSHRLHPLIGFEVQTDKPPPTWVWDPNQETITVILRSKSSNCQPWFWGTNQETIAVVLRPNHWQTVATGFEAKPENLWFSSPPRVRYGSHMTSNDLPIVRPLSTRLVPNHLRSSTPSFLLLLDPHRCCHITFFTYTSRDKQTCFSTLNNWIWVSSTDINRIQIQTRTSQLLITYINQGTKQLVSQSPPWWVHWQL
jgi:hypothetical protein